MLTLTGILSWMVSKFRGWWNVLLTSLLPAILGVLEICGCLLRFCVWMIIFSISSVLHLLGFFFLAAISVLGQVTSLFEQRRRRRKRRRQVVNNGRHQDFRNPSPKSVGNGMDYDSVIRTTRGLYSCRFGLNRPKTRSVGRWFPENGYDSSYYTADSISTASEASWTPSRNRFPKAII